MVKSTFSYNIAAKNQSSIQWSGHNMTAAMSVARSKKTYTHFWWLVGNRNFGLGIAHVTHATVSKELSSPKLRLT